MLQNINNIIITGQDFEFDQDVINGMHEILSNAGKMKDSDLLKAIGADPKKVKLNFTEIQGNSTRNEFIKVFLSLWSDLGNDINSLSSPIMSGDVARILKDLSLPENLLDLDLTLEGNEFDKQAFFKLWHLIYTVEDDEVLIKNLEKTCQKAMLKHFWGLNWKIIMVVFLQERCVKYYLIYKKAKNIV
jgi:CRISPR-associated endonuclease Csn1